MKLEGIRGLLAALAGATIIATTATASAAVRHEGDWGDEDDDPTVSLDLDRTPRGEAVKRLAEVAGWSVVFEGAPTDPVDIHVRKQPPARVLDLLLGDADYAARRDDNLLAIRKLGPATSAPPVPPVPPVPAPPAAPTSRGADRMITGSSLVVQRDETVHDVTVFGGSLEILGTVTGDVTVTGGSISIRRGARVFGDVQSMGGSIDVQDGATVTGDVLTYGGSVRRAAGATVRGDVRENARGRHHGRERHDHDAHEERSGDSASSSEKTGSHWARAAASAITRTALLFVFGCVLLALMTPRMESLRARIAGHPMRTMATGILGLLGALITLAALCVTIIGIPFAIVGVLLAVVLVAAGVVSVLETAGCALLGHRTQNPYVHLALGCLLLLVLGAIPFVGGFIKALVVLFGAGAIVATRAGGLLRRKPRPADLYREAALDIG